jgi:hypothetical protein
MKKVIKYVSFDGLCFDTERECHEYEHDRCNEMIDTIRQIKAICDDNGINCKHCIFNADCTCIIAQMTQIGKEGCNTPNFWKGTFKLD